MTTIYIILLFGFTMLAKACWEMYQLRRQKEADQKEWLYVTEKADRESLLKDTDPVEQEEWLVATEKVELRNPRRTRR
jgi:hypothetical protein